MLGVLFLQNAVGDWCLKNTSLLQRQAHSKARALLPDRQDFGKDVQGAGNSIACAKAIATHLDKRTTTCHYNITSVSKLAEFTIL